MSQINNQKEEELQSQPKEQVKTDDGVQFEIRRRQAAIKIQKLTILQLSLIFMMVVVSQSERIQTIFHYNIELNIRNPITFEEYCNHHHTCASRYSNYYKDSDMRKFELWKAEGKVTRSEPYSTPGYVIICFIIVLQTITLLFKGNTILIKFQKIIYCLHTLSLMMLSNYVLAYFKHSWFQQRMTILILLHLFVGICTNIAIYINNLRFQCKLTIKQSIMYLTITGFTIIFGISLFQNVPQFIPILMVSNIYLIYYYLQLNQRLLTIQINDQSQSKIAEFLSQTKKIITLDENHQELNIRQQRNLLAIVIAAFILQYFGCFKVWMTLIGILLLETQIISGSKNSIQEGSEYYAVVLHLADLLVPIKNIKDTIVE